jgi:lipopolysaccharide export system permease protein
MKNPTVKIFSGFTHSLSIIDWYLTKELILPFLFGMGIFTSLGLSIGTVFDLVRKVTESGLLLGVALQILILKLPEFIVLAFPMSMLLATLMAYSRLSSDSELIALRSIGVNLYRLILPAIYFSLIVVLITFFFNNFVAPAANHQADIALEQALEKNSTELFKERNILYPEYTNVDLPNGDEVTNLNRLFYAEEFDGDRMKDITVLDRSQKDVSQIITARSGTWNILENTWDFYDGNIYILGKDGSYQNIIRFQHQQLALPRAPLDLTQKGQDYNEMNLFQSLEYLKILKLGGKEQKIRKLEVRIQEKISLPFVCLVFALIGTAIGIKPQNASKGKSFGICIGLIFAYYLLSIISSSLGIRGTVSPFLAAWLPNIIGFGAAGVLLSNSSSNQ